MGAYLSSPVLDKESDDGKSARLRFGLSSMQGWRRTMEDAHLALTELNGDGMSSLFGVFDGHGGKEVAIFVARHLAEELVSSEEYRKGDLETAMRRVFHRMDEMLRLPENVAEVRSYKEGRPHHNSSNGRVVVASGAGSTLSPPTASSSASGGRDNKGQSSPPSQQQPKGITEALEMIQKILITNSASEQQQQQQDRGGLPPSQGVNNPAVLAAAEEEEDDDDDIMMPMERSDSTMDAMMIKSPQDSSSSGSPSSPTQQGGDQMVVEEAVEVEHDDDDEEEDEDDSQPVSLSLPLRAALGGGSGRYCNLPDHPIQAGCTSVVALLIGDQLVVANAGDSRAVLCRGGKAVALSEDHKPMQDREHDRIRKAGGFVTDQGRVNGNLNLSRSIGDLKYKGNTLLPPKDQMITAEPDVTRITITEEDEFFILACDGIWDCMSNQQAVDYVRERLLQQRGPGGKRALSAIVEELLNDCVSDDPRRTAGIGGDNMTCMIVEINGGVKPRPTKSKVEVAPFEAS